MQLRIRRYRLLHRSSFSVLGTRSSAYLEARFEPKSYGFRPGRGCHDAIQRLMLGSRSNALVSVRRVTERNSGRLTAGLCERSSRRFDGRSAGLTAHPSAERMGGDART
jgi:hypothetical protein